MKSTAKKNRKMVAYGTKDVLQPGDLDPRNIREKITVWLDQDILDELRRRAKLKPGGKYQRLLNDILRDALFKKSGEASVEERLQRIEKELFSKHG